MNKKLNSKEYKSLTTSGAFIDVTQEALSAGLQTTTLLAERLYKKLRSAKVELNRLFSLLIVAIMQSDGHTFNILFPGPFPDAPSLCGKLLCDELSEPILTISYAD
jgi:hypothetical protein